MDFKDTILGLEKEVDELMKCGRTPYKDNVSLQTSDLEALKKTLQETLGKLEKPPK